eukprot:1741083-Prymnesium_polylepis.1
MDAETRPTDAGAMSSERLQAPSSTIRVGGGKPPHLFRGDPSAIGSLDKEARRRYVDAIEEELLAA